MLATAELARPVYSTVSSLLAGLSCLFFLAETRVSSTMESDPREANTKHTDAKDSKQISVQWAHLPPFSFASPPPPYPFDPSLEQGRAGHRIARRKR